MTARMEMLDQLEPKRNMKEELKCVLIEFGVLCAALDTILIGGRGLIVITGEHQIVMLYANNLDTWNQVQLYLVLHT